MIVLDTNVISEMMTGSPHPDVATWLAFQPRQSVFTTTISQAEILAGLRVLPGGKRKERLEAQAVAMFSTEFVGRVLPFDGDAAECYADITAHRRSLGRPISQLDAQIAALAYSHHASLATRNVRDFEHLGLDIINPWDFRA
jgi:predicted nucleic acid-binding protein